MLSVPAERAEGHFDLLQEKKKKRAVFHMKALPFHLQMMLPTTRLAFRASLIAQLVKNLPTMGVTLVQFLGREDSLEKE